MANRKEDTSFENKPKVKKELDALHKQHTARGYNHKK